MKINNILLENNIFLREIRNITPKTKKKIEVYLGVDMKSNYYLLVELNTKSRFLIKNAKELIEFVTLLSDITFKKNKKVLFIEAPICSKAKQFLKQEGWKIL